VRDIAIVSFAQSTPGLTDVQETETQLLFPVINEALERINITRKDIGFTCSASCDYLAGAPFAFVQTLEATGAWPPISESHVEMDGAWALYEAWVRLQHGDVDVALAFSSGICSRADIREVLSIQLDPYYLAPLWLDPLSLGRLQAEAAGLEPPTEAPTYSDAAAAVILAAGDRARELVDRPAWISGIDHRSDAHYPGVRDLSRSVSARIAGEQAGVDKAPVDVAYVSAQFPHEAAILKEALGLSDAHALDTSPLMVAGLIQIGRAANAVISGDASRAVGHATAGPCLQQNLVAVMEA
jgi:hypothetical protein